MQQIDILRHAKDYLDQLDNHTDPLSGEVLPTASAARSDEVRKIFYFTSRALGKIITYDEGTDRPAFSITPEQISRLTPADAPVKCMDVVDRINKAVDLSKCRELSSNALMAWLTEQGYLRGIGQQGHYRRFPTSRGRALGIRTVDGEWGPFVTYAPAAQQFIFSHLEDIARSAAGSAGKWKKTPVPVDHPEMLQLDLRAMERLSRGCHPATQAPLDPGDPLGRERLRKCFAFVAQALARSLEAGYFTAKGPFTLPRELWGKFPVDRNVMLGELTRNIGALLSDPTAVEYLAGDVIRRYLVGQGLLAEIPSGTRYKSYRPTPQGNAVGIVTEECPNAKGDGTFTAVLYTPAAQEYLARHMGELIDLAAR